jgi:hypothetical protein
VSEVFHIINQEFDLLISFDSLYASPSSDEGNYIFDKCKSDCVLILLVTISRNVRGELSFLVQPAAKTESDHPAACNDACTANPTPTMDEDRDASQRITVNDIDQMGVQTRR